MEEKLQDIYNRLEVLESAGAQLGKLEQENTSPIIKKIDANTEVKSQKSSTEKFIELSSKSFKEVLDSDIHLDNKASRILTAVAFLTAAAATIFVNKFDPNKLQLIPVVNTSINLAEYAFITFTFSVLLGAGFYLCALGPSLNLPKTSPSKKVNSLIFFDTVGSLDIKDWREHWNWKADENSLENLQEEKLKSLQEQMKDNLIWETHLVAQKTRTKYSLMSLGSACFRLSLASLMVMIPSLLLEPSILWSLIGLTLLSLVFTTNILVRPSRSILWVIFWSFLSFVLFCTVVLYLIY